MKQSTCETCLPTCLIFLLRNLGIKIGKSEEMNILIKGLKFTRIDYAIGQLVYIVRRYKVNATLYVEFREFFNQLRKLPIPPKLTLINKKVDVSLLKKLLKAGYAIVYLDQFFIGYAYHYPHFVALLEFKNSSAKIFDPWDGKEKKVTKSEISKGIQSLGNKWKISPKAIQVFL